MQIIKGEHTMELNTTDLKAIKATALTILDKKLDLEEFKQQQLTTLNPRTKAELNTAIHLDDALVSDLSTEFVNHVTGLLTDVGDDSQIQRRLNHLATMMELTDTLEKEQREAHHKALRRCREKLYPQDFLGEPLTDKEMKEEARLQKRFDVRARQSLRKYKSNSTQTKGSFKAIEKN